MLEISLPASWSAPYSWHIGRGFENGLNKILETTVTISDNPSNVDKISATSTDINQKYNLTNISETSNVNSTNLSATSYDDTRNLAKFLETTDSENSSNIQTAISTDINQKYNLTNISEVSSKSNQQQHISLNNDFMTNTEELLSLLKNVVEQNKKSI